MTILPNVHGKSATRWLVCFVITTALVFSIFAAPAGALNNAPQAVADPAQVAQGATLTLHLSGFAGNTQVTIMLDNVRVSLWSDYTDGQGSLDKHVTVPVSFSDGTHRIVVTDASGNQAQTNLTVQGNQVPASIQVQPNSGIPGVNLVITGSNWQRNQKTVVMQGPDGGTQNLAFTDLCVVEDCPSGSLHLDAQIPAGAAAGAYTVTVSDGILQASTALNVLPVVNPSPSAQPGLVLQPPSGPARSYVTINGSGFSSNAGLWLEWDGNEIDPQQTLMRTDARGVFSGLIIQVPMGAAPGAHKVLVMDGTIRVQATFTVSSQSVTPPPVVNPPAPVNPPVPVPGPAPAPAPTPSPAPAPAPSGCNPGIPMYAQPGCAGGNTSVTPAPAPVPGPVPTPAPSGCNPGIPMYAQPGCAGGGAAVTPTPAPGPGPGPAPAPSGCNPSIPMYAQPGCAAGQQQSAAQSVAPRQQIARQASLSAQAKTSSQPKSSSGSASVPARTAQPCKPNVPKYAQPGCTSK